MGGSARSSFKIANRAARAIATCATPRLAHRLHFNGAARLKHFSAPCCAIPKATQRRRSLSRSISSPRGMRHEGQAQRHRQTVRLRRQGNDRRDRAARRRHLARGQVGQGDRRLRFARGGHCGGLRRAEAAMTSAEQYPRDVEISAAMADELASWRRTIHESSPEADHHELLRMAATSLWRALEIDRTVHPESYDATFQIAVDELTELAEFVGIDADDAQ